MIAHGPAHIGGHDGTVVVEDRRVGAAVVEDAGVAKVQVVFKRTFGIGAALPVDIAGGFVKDAGVSDGGVVLDVVDPHAVEVEQHTGTGGAAGDHIGNDGGGRLIADEGSDAAAVVQNDVVLEVDGGAGADLELLAVVAVAEGVGDGGLRMPEWSRSRPSWKL